MILITGGAGFIGSNLINELLRINIKVVICDYKKKKVVKNHLWKWVYISAFPLMNRLESHIFLMCKPTTCLGNVI